MSVPILTQSDSNSSDHLNLPRIDACSSVFRFVPYHNHIWTSGELHQSLTFFSDQPGRAFLARGQDDLDRIIVAELNGWATLYAVLDGHSNSSVVDELEYRFPEYLASALMPFHPTCAIRLDFDQIQSAIQATIDQFEHDYILPLAEAAHGGAVAVMALLFEQNLIMINLGHARGVLFKSDGQIIFQTEDHLVKRPDEFERITNLGQTIMWNRICCGNHMLSVSRAWGDLKFKQINHGYSNRGPVSLQADITRLSLNNLPTGVNPGEKIYLLLASNGLYKQPYDAPLSSEEMIQPLLPDPLKQAEALLDLAHDRSRDDISFLLIPFF